VKFTLRSHVNFTCSREVHMNMKGGIVNEFLRLFYYVFSLFNDYNIDKSTRSFAGTFTRCSQNVHIIGELSREHSQDIHVKFTSSRSCSRDVHKMFTFVHAYLHMFT